MPVKPTLSKGDRGENVRVLQQRLKQLGESVVPDGIFGPKTRDAVMRYQLNHKLLPDGIVGPLTAAKINAKLADEKPLEQNGVELPPWLLHARKLIGTKEIIGRVHNDTIMSLSRKIATRYPKLAWAASQIFKTDEVPWCGAFVAYALAESGITPDPSYPSALAWRDWGRALDGPAVGAICVKSRQGGGHVAFVLGRSGNNLAILGGNQGNMVKVSPYDRDAFSHFRWPSEYPKPAQVGFNHLPTATTMGQVGVSEG